MELRNERLFEVRERTARRWLLPLLVVAVVALPVAWFGPKFYSKWRQARLLQQSREVLEKDPLRAVVCLRRALYLNRDNVEATRALAEIAEVYVPNEALALRERVCELAPASYPDARAWAKAAVRFGEQGQAEDALELMRKLSPPTTAHHEIAARIALAAGRQQEARAEFAQALALDPGNGQFQLECALLDLRSADPAVQGRARAALDGFRGNPLLRHPATRALIGDRLGKGEVADALRLSREFLLDPETTFADRLQYLSVLRAREEPSGVFLSSFQRPEGLSLEISPRPAETTFTAYLSELQHEAGDDTSKVAALISFLNTQDLSLLAGEWAAHLPRETIAKPPVAPALAEAYRLTANWTRLEQFLADADWAYFEFLRAAFSARVLREKGDHPGAAAQWMNAVNLSDYRPDKLNILERAAAAWGWESEWEELVRTSARSAKRPRAALESLANYYGNKLDTQKFFGVISQLLEIDPADDDVRKIWARLAVPMGNDKFRSGTMAQELFRKYPDDPQVVCTYAHVLHFRDRDDEAIAVMGKLGPEKLRSPPVAGYYGILLFAKNRKAEAADFIARSKGAPYFRDEQELVDKVRRSLD